MRPEHMWHRDKVLTRTIKSELREMWNDFDPIGVSDTVDDEYDMYLGGTLTALKQSDQRRELINYVTQCLSRMGMRTGNNEAEFKLFINNVLKWFPSVEERTREMIERGGAIKRPSEQ